MNVIKYGLVTMAFCSVYTFSCAQPRNEPVGQCFEEANRKAIEKRITKLKLRASKEMNVPIDSISYVVEKKFTRSYTMECRQLPKIVTMYACGQRKTYKCLGLSGLAGQWLFASWVEADLIVIDL